MSKASSVVGVADVVNRRRRWTKLEKRRIVEETLAGGTSVARVARAHEVNANQVHTWRRLYERGLLSAEQERVRLLPAARLIQNEASLAMVRVSGDREVHGQTQRRRAGRSGVIQIEVEHGRLRVEGAADPTALRVVLECLLG